jgi:hypothetical protein
MEYKKLEYYLSQPRLNRFLLASGNSKVKAQKLYRVNLRVSQSFYPILNLFEIFLRNIFNYQVAAYFENPNWILTEKNGFMNDDSLSGSRFYLKNSILSAERTIIRKGGKITAGKVVAEQSFGFWTSLFDTHNYRLIGGIVIHSFRNKPPEINRSAISQKLNRIRAFRNRVYHNEPICFNGNKIDFTYAENIKNEIYEIMSWIDSDLSYYVEYFDAIDNKIKRAKNL